MKEYIKPELKIEKIELEDVIAASNKGTATIGTTEFQKENIGTMFGK